MNDQINERIYRMDRIRDDIDDGWQRLTLFQKRINNEINTRKGLLKRAERSIADEKIKIRMNEMAFDFDGDAWSPSPELEDVIRFPLKGMP